MCILPLFLKNEQLLWAIKQDRDLGLFKELKKNSK
jgi:hypothetical protein